MYNLVLDIGNTAIKVGLFQNNHLEHFTSLKTIDQAKHWLENFPIKKGIVSTVAHSFEEVSASFSPISLIDFAKCKAIGVKNSYKTPHTLGADRLANAVAAVTLYPNQNVVVIDAGTCLKIDFTNKDGVFMGGSIAPGLDMKYKALNHFTARLPLLEHQIPKQTIGVDTKESMKNGVFIGMCHEINGWIKLYMEENKQLTIIGTGGSYPHFEPYLNYPIFAHPNLTLVGLNKTLQLNDN